MSAKTNANGIVIDDKYTTGYQNFNLSNIVCYWVHLDPANPDTAFGNNKWCLEMRLDDEIAAQLKALGFSVGDKTDKDGTVTKNIFKAKKEVMTKSGVAQTPPNVVGPDGKTKWNFAETIGNGTVCNLQLSAKAWPIKGKWKMGCYITGVQVVDHVPYAGSFEDTTKKSDVPF